MVFGNLFDKGETILPESILETERTLLRPFRHKDLVCLNGLYKDAKVIKYKGPRAYTKDRVDKILYASIRHQTTFGYSMWAVIRKSDQQFMGRAGLIHLDNTQEIDLSYALHTRFWRQGYALEITKKVIEWGFSNTDAEYFTAFSDPHNSASIKILDKLGFQFEKTAVQQGRVMRFYKIFRH